jgi:hypothetical protein
LQVAGGKGQDAGGRWQGKIYCNLQPVTCNLLLQPAPVAINHENFWFAVISDVHLQRKKIEGRERVTFPSVFTGNE